MATLTQSFKKADPVVKIAAGVGTYFFVVKPLLAKYGSPSNAAPDLAGNTVNPNNLTKPTAWYSTAAGQLETAMSGAGTDEDTIYNVFSQLGNGDDLLKLIAVFGVRDYSAWYESASYKNLGEWLSAELDSSEMAHVNNILQTKGINFTF